MVIGEVLVQIFFWLERIKNISMKFLGARVTGHYWTCLTVFHFSFKIYLYREKNTRNL